MRLTSTLIGIGARLNAFWFRPISATSFGAMRIGFALLTFLSMASQWNMIAFYYGPDGMLPRSMVPLALRSAYRFSLLDVVGSWGTWGLYLLLLCSLLFVLLGLRTKFWLIISLVLLFSFHEYSPIVLNGGDTLLRLIGFLLLISPCDRSLSIRNLRRRWALAREGGHQQPNAERHMPIWPYRLLLWQIICMYMASAIMKWSGSTWPRGSAVAIVLHHDSFTRLPPIAQDLATYFSPLMSAIVLLVQSGWGLLLVVPVVQWTGLLPPDTASRLKRLLLVCGVIIHGLITLMMDVDLFSWILLTAYLGLLLPEDWQAIGKLLKVGKKRSLSIVLYDGRCGMCQRSVVFLQSCDWLHRLSFVNYHDASVRKLYAPDTSLATLDRMLHVRTSDQRLLGGISAFVFLATILPPLWPFLPFLSLPGAQWIAGKIYSWIARRRKKNRNGKAR